MTETTAAAANQPTPPEDSTADHAERIVEILRDTSVAMLITQSEDGVVSARPLALVGEAEKLPERVTFITNAHSAWIADIHAHPVVGLTLQSRASYCFLRGRAQLSPDRERLRGYWSKAQDLWFKDGADDPDAVLLDIHVSHAEYWDSSGAAGLRFAIEAGRALLTGDTVDVSKTGRHAELTSIDLLAGARERGS
jgi:general stress protein 26